MAANPKLRLLWNRDFDRRAADLFDRFRDGEAQERWRALVEEIAPLLVPLLRARLRRAGRPFDARELVQDTFTQVYYARATFLDRGPGSFVKWFLAIAENLLRQESRAQLRRTRREAIAARPVADRAADPFTLLIAGEEERLAGLTWAQVRRLALEAVQQLPPTQWEAFVAYSRHHLSYEQLALQLAIPRGAVIMRIRRARDAVLRHITARIADGSFRERIGEAMRELG